jgi:molybdenum cofactor cytidylyltransferase
MTGFADIAVAVLAAGQGRRFGADKLMAVLDGVPLGLHIGRTLAPMEFGWRFAICAKDSPIEQQYAALGFAVIGNATPESGQAGSLHMAVKAVERTQASALLVVLADMPFITAPHIARIAASGGLTASHDGHAPMPPALFPRSVWPELLATKGDAGARRLLGGAKILMAASKELQDIDLPADLPRAHQV